MCMYAKRRAEQIQHCFGEALHNARIIGAEFVCSFFFIFRSFPCVVGRRVAYATNRAASKTNLNVNANNWERVRMCTCNVRTDRASNESHASPGIIIQVKKPPHNTFWLVYFCSYCCCCCRRCCCSHSNTMKIIRKHCMQISMACEVSGWMMREAHDSNNNSISNISIM